MPSNFVLSYKVIPEKNGILVQIWKISTPGHLYRFYFIGNLIEQFFKFVKIAK